MLLDIVEDEDEVVEARGAGKRWQQIIDKPRLSSPHNRRTNIILYTAYTYAWWLLV